MMLPNSPDRYTKLLTDISAMNNDDQHAAMRSMAKGDLFFLLVYVLKRRDFNNKWAFDRCRDVQSECDGVLDCWARGHGKSIIKTFANVIRMILINPETTVCIFSHTRNIAKAFLTQIKSELENNELLKKLFPDVLYQFPQKQATRWNTEEIVVKRKTNPKEATVEAWGIVDSQPISKHFDILNYDDGVTDASVNTPEQIEKTLERYELSLKLGKNGDEQRWYTGTRYHFNDLYSVLIKRGLKTRIFPATKDGTPTGEPYFMSREAIRQSYEDGVDTFYKQMLQNPRTDEMTSFKIENIRYYLAHPPKESMNIYILVDPASAKKKGSDFTCMWVVGCAEDGNYYIVDCIYDKLNLTERGSKLLELHRKWMPNDVAYERYGMMGDIDYIKERMERDGYNFKITEVGGQMEKTSRIKRLEPDFENGRIMIPREMKRFNWEYKNIDITQEFIKEFESFPVGTHDDMLDALSRIKDISVVFPQKDVYSNEGYNFMEQFEKNGVTGY